MSHAEIAWNGIILELLSERGSAEFTEEDRSHKGSEGILKQNPGDCIGRTLKK